MQQVDIIAEGVVGQFPDKLIDREDGGGEAGLRDAGGQFLLQHSSRPLVRKDYQRVFQWNVITLQDGLGELPQEGHSLFFSFAKIILFVEDAGVSFFIFAKK